MQYHLLISLLKPRAVQIAQQFWLQDQCARMDASVKERDFCLAICICRQTIAAVELWEHDKLDKIDFKGAHGHLLFLGIVLIGLRSNLGSFQFENRDMDAAFTCLEKVAFDVQILQSEVHREDIHIPLMRTLLNELHSRLALNRALIMASKGDTTLALRIMESIFTDLEASNDDELKITGYMIMTLLMQPSSLEGDNMSKRLFYSERALECANRLKPLHHTSNRFRSLIWRFYANDILHGPSGSDAAQIAALKEHLESSKKYLSKPNEARDVALLFYQFYCSLDINSEMKQAGTCNSPRTGKALKEKFAPRLSQILHSSAQAAQDIECTVLNMAGHAITEWINTDPSSSAVARLQKRIEQLNLENLETSKDHKALIAEFYMKLGNMHMKEGDLPEAKCAFEFSIRLLCDINVGRYEDQQLWCRVSSNLAVIHMLQLQFDAAILQWRQMIKTATRFGLEQEITIGLEGLSTSLFNRIEQGELSAKEISKTARECLEISKRLHAIASNAHSTIPTIRAQRCRVRAQTILTEQCAATISETREMSYTGKVAYEISMNELLQASEMLIELIEDRGNEGIGIKEDRMDAYRQYLNAANAHIKYLNTRDSKRYRIRKHALLKKKDDTIAKCECLASLLIEENELNIMGSERARVVRGVTLY